MKIKNKILFILIFLLLMLVSTRCYAVNTNLYFDSPQLNNLGSLPTVSGCDDYIIIGTESCSVASIYFIRNTNDAKEKVSISYTDSTNAQLETSISFKTWYRFTSGSWSQKNTTVTSVSMNLNSQRILYSTIDLKDTDGNVVYTANSSTSKVETSFEIGGINYTIPDYSDLVKDKDYLISFCIRDDNYIGVNLLTYPKNLFEKFNIVYNTDLNCLGFFDSAGSSTFQYYCLYQLFGFADSLSNCSFNLASQGSSDILVGSVFVHCGGYQFSTNMNAYIATSSLPLIQEEMPDIKYPYIVNTETLKSVEFDYLCINGADFYEEKWQDFYLLCYDYSTESADTLSIYPRKEIFITRDSQYLSNTEGYYSFLIPRGNLGIDYKNGRNYAFKLAIKDENRLLSLFK